MELEQQTIVAAVQKINKQMLKMASRVETALRLAASAYNTGATELMAQVIADDTFINTDEITIDKEIASLNGVYSPNSKELRFIIAAIKIVKDLERIGDHAVNIAQTSQRLAVHEKKITMELIIKIGEAARIMLTQSIAALKHDDSLIALSIFASDDTVDELCNMVETEVITRLKKPDAPVEMLLLQYKIARNWERVGDLATNIAENIIYHLSGSDVRHQANCEKSLN